MMAEPVKIPEQHLLYQPAFMKKGDKAVFPWGVLRVDYEGYGWIDPLATSVSRSPNPPLLENIVLECVEGGFKVELGGNEQSKGPYWTQDQKPEPKDGFPWFPVVEFIPRKMKPQ